MNCAILLKQMVGLRPEGLCWVYVAFGLWVSEFCDLDLMVGLGLRNQNLVFNYFRYEYK